MLRTKRVWSKVLAPLALVTLILVTSPRLSFGSRGGAGINLSGSPPPAPPVLPDTFTTDFLETNDYFVHSFHTAGVLYYDFKSGSERVDRESGEGDRYCGSAQLFRNTPCTHLVKNSTRYLIFPKLKSCCKCCTSAHGCGILRKGKAEEKTKFREFFLSFKIQFKLTFAPFLKPDFLLNASFVGYETRNGTQSEHWRIEGLQENDYWQTVRGKPLELYQKPNDKMNFVAFSEDPIDPSTFDLPSSCDRQCGGTCALVGSKTFTINKS